MDSNKRLAITGMFWTGLQMVINQGFNFIVRLVLARLLYPEQFGIVGMATVFIGFVQTMNELGIGAALVQRKEENLRQAHYHTAFWTGVIWSVSLFAILSVVVAPLAAIFYKEPLLRTLIPVISIGILLSPVNLVNRAQLTKRMNFKQIAFAENVSNVAAGIISIVLAFMGAGVWSLAFNSTAVVIFGIPLYFRATGWLPKFIWEKQAFKDIFGFGIYTTGTNVFNYLMNNVDYLLIGKLISAQALGAYTFAFLLTDAFKNKLTAVVGKVMYPLYVKMQSDREGAKRVYLKVVEYNCIVVYPFMIFLIVLGQPFILEMFGAKWSDSLLPLQLLAIAVMIQMLVYSNTVLIRGLGRPDFELKLQIVKSIIYIPTLVLGVYFNGIVGASWAVLINRLAAIFITNYTFRIFDIKISYRNFLSMIKVPLLASLISGIIGFTLYHFLTIHFIISGAVMAIFYAGSIFLMKKGEMVGLIREFKSKRKAIN